MATQLRPKLRILCLHGRCQTAATFETKLERLRQKSAHFADFVFLVDAMRFFVEDVDVKVKIEIEDFFQRESPVQECCMNISIGFGIERN